MALSWRIPLSLKFTKNWIASVITWHVQLIYTVLCILQSTPEMFQLVFSFELLFQVVYELKAYLINQSTWMSGQYPKNKRAKINFKIIISLGFLFIIINNSIHKEYQPTLEDCLEYSD